MIQVEEVDGGLRVVDAAKNEVEIEIDDWVPGGEPMEIDRRLDEVVSGTASGIRSGGTGVLLESTHLNKLETLTPGNSMEIGKGDHLLQLSTGIPIYLRIHSSVEIDVHPRGTSISIPPDTPISIGARLLDEPSSEVVSCPPTVEGLAAVVSEFGLRPDTLAPDRSYPSNRPALPDIEVQEGAEERNPSSLDHAEERLTISIPNAFEYLFPVAPLAYYLGAHIVVNDEPVPTIHHTTRTLELGQTSPFAVEVASLLHRVFYLDCLVREWGKYEVGLQEATLIENTSMDPEEVYTYSMADRFVEYLSFPFESIVDELPEWPLSMRVAPTSRSIPSISYLLDRLSLVFTEAPAPVEPNQVLNASLDGFSRSAARRIRRRIDPPIHDVPPMSVDAVVRGAIGEGVSLDAFTCPVTAISNQRKYLDDTSLPVSIAIVQNEASMETEYSAAEKVYRERADSYSIRVDKFENVSRNELADIIETGYDFLHYIGHCNTFGLECTDGPLASTSLNESNVRTFFLNACGSYDEGFGLIEKGSVVGVITIGDVLDGQAAQVGSTFAQLLMHGISFNRALHSSRRHAIMNRYYGILGDGTESIIGQNFPQSDPITVQSTEQGEFRICIRHVPLKNVGAISRRMTDSAPVLLGNDLEMTTSQEKFQELIQSLSDFREFDTDTILFDGKFYWPEQLLEELF